MELSEKSLKRIQKVIRLFKNYLRFSTVGPHTLTASELKELIRTGWIGRNSKPGTAIAEAYLTTHVDQSTSPAGTPKTIREGAINALERMAALYSDKAADQLGADVVATLETHFLPFIDRKEGHQIYEVLKNPENHGKYLGSILHGKVKAWRPRFKTIVQTELARASNWGSTDAILHNNPDKKPDEIYVYKRGSHSYAESCPICQKFWFTSSGAPKVYPLSELLANGSNIGKKQAEWKPTVDNTHPSCVHILHEIRDGYGFDADGGLTYVSKEHREFAHQNKQ